MSIIGKIQESFINWVLKEPPPNEYALCDFGRIQFELRPCDVILTGGRSRVSEVVSMVTQSPWTHAALYIGRLHDIENPVLRSRIMEFYQAAPDEQLLVESMLGKGTIVSPLKLYENIHIRICRPKGISSSDAQKVIGFAIGRLGTEYGVRHILDLLRLLYPWSFLPRKFRSSLFEYNADSPTSKEICSSMLAEAFHSVRFPILPFIKKSRGNVQFYQRNPKLYTPRDFDYSPYFEIIKYPIFEVDHHAVYRQLPWNEEVIANEYQDIRDEDDTPTGNKISPNAAQTPKKETDIPQNKEEY